MGKTGKTGKLQAGEGAQTTKATALPTVDIVGIGHQVSNWVTVGCQASKMVIPFRLRALISNLIAESRFIGISQIATRLTDYLHCLLWAPCQPHRTLRANSRLRDQRGRYHAGSLYIGECLQMNWTGQRTSSGITQNTIKPSITSIRIIMHASRQWYRRILHTSVL